MQTEQLSDKEAIYILIVFVFGSSLIISSGGGAKNDAWISLILSVIMAVPLFYVYSRLLSLFHGQSLFDILILILDKKLGVIITILYVWYAFHLGALVLRNFAEFINIAAMPETPMLVPLFAMGLVCMIAAWLGIEVFGRTCTFFLPILFAILLMVQLFVIPQLHLNYIKPTLSNGFSPVIKGAFSTFAFPFAETVLLVCVFSLQTKKSPYRVYFWGILLAAIIMTIITIRNIAVLGTMLDDFYFPSYEAVSRISIGEFLQRIEVTVSIVFAYCVFSKTTVCLLAACKGMSKVFKLKNYRSIVIQMGLLMIYFSYIVYDNTMQMIDWAINVYPYYAFPFQVIIPLIVWIVAEIKNKKTTLNSQ